MGLPDLVLVHPPSTYRNPSSLRMHGMVTASVTSTPAAELYPLGFLSIAAYLEKHGYTVAIRNLALVTSLFPRARPYLLRRFLRASVVGIDLHWATNIDGALEVARTVKHYSSRTPVVMGGLTASWFWKELLAKREIDFVVRGDCAEYPFLKLLDTLKNKGSLRDVPNLAWREPDGTVVDNGINYVPEYLDEFPLDYGLLIRSSARMLDPLGALLTIPYRDWLTNPVTALITQKGCPHDCVFCGGSATAYASLSGRRQQAVKSPSAVMKDIRSIVKITRAPIYFVGDLRDPGEGYAQEMFRLYRTEGLKNPLIIETLRPADRKFFERAVSATPGGVTFMLTADTHDDELRLSFGRMYTTFEIENTIRNALEAGCQSVMVFFGIGLPGQDAESVMRTVEYCERLLSKFNGRAVSTPGSLKKNRVYPFISPYLPFIEPGSRVYLTPTKYGYKNFAASFEDLSKAMLKTSWSDTLAYATDSMDRDTIVRTTYRALIELNRVHEKFCLISPRARRKEEERLKSEYDSLRAGAPYFSLWLQGESSLYAPGLRGRLCNLLKFRARGILKETARGLKDRFLQARR